MPQNMVRFALREDNQIRERKDLIIYPWQWQSLDEDVPRDERGWCQLLISHCCQQTRGIVTDMI